MSLLDLSKKCTQYILTMVSEDVPVSQLLPTGTRRIRMQARPSAAIRYGFTEASVTGGNPDGPYWTVKAGAVLDVSELDFSAKTIWVASVDGVGLPFKVELEAYTKN